VIPVLGLPIGFVAGIYGAEFARLGSTQAAWPSTRQAVTAVGLSLLIELAFGLFAAAIWLFAVIFI
jgi:ABC-type phosphate transport system permease subunit